jgi:hypothetical protein
LRKFRIMAALDLSTRRSTKSHNGFTFLNVRCHSI